jgi:16S rRNA (guanine527-N7)-methyltransferase
MDSENIIRLLRPYVDLGQHARGAELAQQTLAYIDLLLKWNAKINLTAVRDAETMVTRHFGESFFAANQLVPQGWTGSVIDMGSGAGFPGLPLAMLAPEARVTLIESANKKAAFLNEVIFALQLRNARVFNQRAEDYTNHADLVTMRAVEKFDIALPVALSLVVESGRLAVMIGSQQVSKAESLVHGVEWQMPIEVPGGHSRVLLVGAKKVKVE